MKPATLFAIAISISIAASQSAAPLTPPSRTLRLHRSSGFEASVPQNWTAVTSKSGNTTYLAAPDGKWEIEGGMTIALGMIVEFGPASNGTLKTAADRVVQDLEANNPGTRILVRIPATLSGNAAESFIVEGPSAIRGLRERTWLVIAVTGGRAFFVTLTSPISEYDSLKPLFDRIMASVRLR